MDDARYPTGPVWLSARVPALADAATARSRCRRLPEIGGSFGLVMGARVVRRVEDRQPIAQPAPVATGIWALLTCWGPEFRVDVGQIQRVGRRVRSPSARSIVWSRLVPARQAPFVFAKGDIAKAGDTLGTLSGFQPTPTRTDPALHPCRCREAHVRP